MSVLGINCLPTYTKDSIRKGTRDLTDTRLGDNLAYFLIPGRGGTLVPNATVQSVYFVQKRCGAQIAESFVGVIDVTNSRSL